jgi:hypothetical protein
MGCQAHLSLQLDLLYDNLKQLRTRLFFVANTHKRVNTDYYENTHNNIDIDYTNEANPFKIYLSGID